MQNKMTKTTISLKKSEGIMHSVIKSIQGTKPAGKLWYDLLKSIFINVKMIRISSDHAIFSWVFNTYKSFLAVETDDILMET